MIERYSLKDMADVWSEVNKYRFWIEVEKAHLTALKGCGVVAAEVIDPIVELLRVLVNDEGGIRGIISSTKIKEYTTHHDFAAFVDVLADYVKVAGLESRWVHYGLTSSDVIDTALSLQIRQAQYVVYGSLVGLEDVLYTMAQTYEDTPIMGRTHGQYAEPTTLGLILLNYYMEFLRHQKRLNAAMDVASVGKLSGAVGVSAHLPFECEQLVMADLGLECAPTSNQILQRDRHAEVVGVLAMIGCSIEKLATQIRVMSRSEVGEVAEGFGVGQKGSSAMPHKHNPVLSENLCGLSRVLRGYALTAMEDVALWGERDISHSSAERIILPDAFGLAHFMLVRMNEVLTGLVVNVDRMKANIDDAGDAWKSQAFMLVLSWVQFGAA